MSEQFLYPGSILSLPRTVALQLLKRADGEAALYYLALLADCVSDLPWSRAQIEAANATLIDLGLLDRMQAPQLPTAAPKLEDAGPPTYQQEDIALTLKDRADFPPLVAAIEQSLGKRLTPLDLQGLLVIYDYLALPPEVILLLCNYCNEQQRSKYGEGRRATLPLMKKEAFRWQREGVDTLDSAEAFLQKLARRSESATRILPLLDIHGRSPVAAERTYLEAWSEMGFADDALRFAYEKTVMKKQSLSWAYMNSILRRWHEKSLHTKAAVEQAEQTRGPWQQKPSATPVERPETQARTRQDMDRLERLMQQSKGE